MDKPGHSPLKAFFKRHSPIKTRSKAIPTNARDDGSPTRAPMRELSANVSPSKDSKVHKRKISGFMRSKPNTSDEPPLPPKHTRTSSIPSRTERVHDELVRAKQQEDPRLTDRVQLLEAELEAARAELAQANAKQSPRRKAMSPRRLRPQLAKRAHSYDVHPTQDRDDSARHERMARDNKYDGLVESLLERDYESANARAASYSVRSVTPSQAGGLAETGRRSAQASYHDLNSKPAGNTEDDAEQLKRKRSELRAAEWKRIQEAYSHNPQRSVTTGSKRGWDTSATTHDEPPARRQKQVHDPLEDQTLPKPARHARRSASESHAPSVLELNRDTIKPIQSQPYKIEYVRTRPHTPENARGQKASRSPPKGRPTYDLMKAFGSNTPNDSARGKVDNENIETFGANDEPAEEEDGDRSKANHELLLYISEHLLYDDLFAIALTSRKLNRIVSNRFQHHSTLKRRYGNICDRVWSTSELRLGWFDVLTRLLKGLFPVEYVRTVRITCCPWYFYEMPTFAGVDPRSAEAQQPWDPTDIVLATQAAKASPWIYKDGSKPCGPKSAAQDMEDFDRELKEGDMDNVLAILLPLLTNVERLELAPGMDGAVEEEDERMGSVPGIVERVANGALDPSRKHELHRMQNPAPYNAFQNLHYLLYDFSAVQDLPHITTFWELLPWISLPSVRRIDIYNVQEHHFRWPEAMPKSMAKDVRIFTSRAHRLSLSPLLEFAKGFVGPCLFSQRELDGTLHTHGDGFSDWRSVRLDADGSISSLGEYVYA
ncbi:MAG: hypothetical protein Q9159_004050 [Coniocarpon cinnabarinum]